MPKTRNTGQLTDQQKRFCQYYVKTLNGMDSYKKAYGVKSDDVAKANASRLLTAANINSYIEHLNSRIEETLGISRLKVVAEHAKIAFSSISNFHNDWITRKQFDELTDEEKACIEEISTKVVKIRERGREVGEEEYVKIKLYDKQKSLESLSKMLGYDSPTKIDMTINAPVIEFGE